MNAKHLIATLSLAVTLGCAHKQKKQHAFVSARDANGKLALERPPASEPSVTRDDWLPENRMCLVPKPEPKDHVAPTSGDGINCGQPKRDYPEGVALEACGFKVTYDHTTNNGLVTQFILTPNGTSHMGFPYLNPDESMRRADSVEAFARFNGVYYMLTDEHIWRYDEANDRFEVAAHYCDRFRIDGDAFTHSAIVLSDESGRTIVEGVLRFDGGNEWHVLQPFDGTKFDGCASNLIRESGGFRIEFDTEICSGSAAVVLRDDASYTVIPRRPR